MGKAVSPYPQYWGARAPFPFPAFNPCERVEEPSHRYPEGGDFRIASRRAGGEYHRFWYASAFSPTTAYRPTTSARCPASHQEVEGGWEPGRQPGRKEGRKEGRDRRRTREGDARGIAKREERRERKTSQKQGQEGMKPKFCNRYCGRLNFRHLLTVSYPIETDR